MLTLFLYSCSVYRMASARMTSDIVASNDLRVIVDVAAPNADVSTSSADVSASSADIVGSNDECLSVS